MNNLVIFSLLEVLPIFLFFLYSYLELDSKGGFFENYETWIKEFLLLIVSIGCVLLLKNSSQNYFRGEKKLINGLCLYLLF